MKNSASFSVLIRTKKQMSKGKLPLYVRITVNGKRTEISLKRLVDPEL